MRRCAKSITFLTLAAVALAGPGAAVELNRKICVPYEDMAKLIDPNDRAMVMDRREFKELLAAAKINAQADQGLELAQVTWAEYTGVIEGEKVSLTGRLEIAAMTTDLIAMPLGFARIGLSSILLDKEPAPLGYNDQGRLTLIVQGRTRYRLDVTGAIKLDELTTGGMQMGIGIPAAVAGHMRLSTVGNLDIHATTPITPAVYNKEIDRTETELTIGGHDKLTIVLSGNGRNADEAPILLGESAATIDVSTSHQVLSCLYTVQMLRRGARELQFELPRQWTVSDVACPSLVKWSTDQEGDSHSGDASKTLTVRLRSAKVGTIALHIEASAPQESLSWRSSAVRLRGAAFERGYLMVIPDEGLRIRGHKLTDARQADMTATESAPGMVSSTAGVLYFHWGDNWSVELELSAARLRRTIKGRQSVQASPEQLILTGRFEVTAIDRELFDMSFVVPSQTGRWHMGAIEVNDDTEGFEYHLEPRSDGSLLRIELARPVMPEKVARVKIVLQHVPANWHWPSDAPARTITIPLIRSEADTVSGHVTVSATGDLDAEPTKVPAEFEIIPVGRMASLNIPEHFQHAYSYKALFKSDIELRISRRRPRLAAESIGLITAQARELAGNWRITYTISRASARRLYLLVDKSLERKITITSPAVRFSSKDIVPPGEKTFPLSDELQDQYNLWLLNLDQKATNEVVVEASYAIALPGKEFTAALVRPLCLGQISEQLAVQAGQELALDISTTGAKEVDAIDLPVIPKSANRILSAFRLRPVTDQTERSAAVTLKTVLHDNYEVPSSLVLLANLMTHLDVRGGQRTQVYLRIANVGRQFLTFRLPEQAQLWSLSVDNNPAKPQLSAAGDYQVALGKQREPVVVKIVWAYRPQQATFERQGLAGIELPDLEINRTNWNVIPPPGYRITDQHSNMQTRDLFCPIPAYALVYEFFAENLPGGIIFWPSLHNLGGYDSEGLVYSVASSEQSQEDSMYLAYDQQVAAEATEAGQQVQKAKASQLTAKGRYTLPVDLVYAPGTGPPVRFSCVGTSELVVTLKEQSRMSSNSVVGYALVILLGLAFATKSARIKGILFVFVLVLSALISTWWPQTTYFANGAFMAALSLIPLYLLIAFIRLTSVKLRFTHPPLGKTTATTAILLPTLILAGAVHASSLQTQNSGRLAAKEPPQLIIPYEGDPTKADKSEKVLIPYSRFVRLWNQAHPDDPIDRPPPGTDVSFTDVACKASVENEQLRLILTTEVRTYGRDWVTLPLPMSNLAIAEAVFNNQPAQLSSGPKGTVLMLPGDTAGRLRIVMLTELEYSGRRTSVTISPPPLPAATMKILLPAEDLDLEVDGFYGVITQDPSNPAEWTIPLATARSLTLRWLPKIRGGIADRTLSAFCDHKVSVLHWALVGTSTIEYKFAAGEHDRFTLLLPHSANLTAIEGVNLRDQRQVGEQTTDGRVFKVVEVRLHRPAQKHYQLTARWVSKLPELDKSAQVLLVRAGDVGRESGNVTLYSAGGMDAKVTDVRGGRRVDIEDYNRARVSELSAHKTLPVARYYWPYRPFALSVELRRPAVRPRVHLNQLILISPDRVQLLVEAKLKTEQGQLFEADFFLPAGYELLSAVGPAVENFYERTTSQGNFLHVNFSAGQLETNMALVLVQNDFQRKDFNVPTIAFLDPNDQPLAKQTGRIAVQVDASLEARTVTAQGLKSIGPAVLKDWLDENQVQRVQFAYRYETADTGLILDIDRLATTVRVEVFAAVVLKDPAANYTYRLRYEVSGSPVDHLRIGMPAEYANLVEITSPAMRSVTKSETADGQTEWDVALVNEVTGLIDIALNFALPIDAATKVLPLPRVDVESGGGYRAIVAVQNISRHDITVHDRIALTALPLSEQGELQSVPQQIRQSLQYVFQSFEDTWSLSLDFKPAKPAARIQIVVDLLALTTVVDRNGQCRYEAKVVLQNRSEQFLCVRVPQGLRLWSARVADQPVKPVFPAGAAPDEILIPLVKTSPGGLPYDVHLYFAGSVTKPLDRLTRLQPPAIEVLGIPITHTTWSLQLPSGYRYLRPGGNLSPVAGTAEMMGLAIDARLEQLKRFEKTYRDVGMTPGRAQTVAHRNWKAFNEGIAEQIELAESNLKQKEYQVGSYEYGRLKNKFTKQKQIQADLIRSNRAFISRQQQQAENDMNVYLNTTNENPGLSEDIRNSILFERPDFVVRNEALQIENLQKQLNVSQKQLEQLGAEAVAMIQPAPQRDAPASQDEAGNAVQPADMTELLSRLSQQNVAQIDQRQAQIRGRIAELQDNRGGRFFQKIAVLGTRRAKGKRKAARRPSRSSGRGHRADKESEVKGYFEDGNRKVKDESALASVSGVELDSYGSSSAPVAATPSGTTTDQVETYVAGGVYPLAVSLPAGEVRLDFARPGGEAVLSVWALRASVVHALYRTLAIFGLCVLVVALAVVWPRNIKRQPMTTKYAIVYTLTAVFLIVLLGLLGMLIAAAIITAFEITRALPARRVRHSQR